MIDTHQHLLHPKRFNYAWAKDFPALQGELELEQYRAASAGCGIEGTVFVEVDVDEAQSGDEARYFCKLADDPANGILGVVAAGRPEQDGFAAYLDTITHPKLKGIRRVLHTQSDEVSASGRFRENVRALADRGLSFDLCVLECQLPLAVKLVAACPDVTFILDHCGVPDIAGNDAPAGDGFHAWKNGIEALAGEPNTVCKISGLTAYAPAEQRTISGLRPYTDTVIDAFGPSRLVWGGDWPVVNLGAGMARWCELTRTLLSGLDAGEQQLIFSTNPRRIYHL